MIYIPNNSENLCVGYAKSIEKVSISKNSHLLIVDVVTKKEKIAIGESPRPKVRGFLVGFIN